MAVILGAAAPAFADAQAQAQAARKAERRGEWKRALEDWKAAYAAEVNAEYLIGIADCHAKLGNTAEAKKNYSAYLADPLALPANVEKVKAKLAALDSSAATLALPGGGLTLPGAAPAAPPPLPSLDLAGPAAAEEKGGRKGKQKKGNEAAPPPGLDLPGAPPVQVAQNNAGVLALPGLDLPASPPARKEPEKNVAATSPTLALPGLPLPSQTTTRTEKKDPAALAAGSTPAKPISTTNTPGQQIAMNTGPAPQKTDRHVPDAVIADVGPTRRSQAEASGANRTVAYVAAGVAVVALGGGAFAFTKAGSAHSELTGKIHDGATAQSLLETEAKNKTLSFVGFAGGLVAAGIATALFAF